MNKNRFGPTIPLSLLFQSLINLFYLFFDKWNPQWEMIFRKHGMNPGKSIRWHLNSDRKKKRIKLYPGPGNRKMTRFVSNSYSALYRIYFSKRGKRERKKEGTKIFNNLYSYSYWTPVAAGRTHHFSCTQRARTANRRLIQRAHTQLRAHESGQRFD